MPDNQKPVEEKSVVPIKTNAEIRAAMSTLTTSYDPDPLLHKYQDPAKLPGVGETSDGTNDMFKISTLFEFDNGILMSVGVAEYYKTFSIELMRKLKKEFDCNTTSQRATAELAATNYVRTLDIQRRINTYLDKGSITDMGVRFLGVMSKELDRANRHYLTAIQTLRMLKQPPLQLNIKATTAVVGQNQVVQTRND